MLLEFDADQKLWQETVRDAVAKQCPPTQKCLEEEKACGFFLSSSCEGESAMSAMIPDGN